MTGWRRDSKSWRAVRPSLRAESIRNSTPYRTASANYWRIQTPALGMLRVKRPQGSIKRTVDAFSQGTSALLGSADSCRPFGFCGFLCASPVDFGLVRGVRSCGALGLAFVAFFSSFGFIGFASSHLASSPSLDFPCLSSASLALPWTLLVMAASVSVSLRCDLGCVNVGASGHLLAPLGFMWIHHLLR